jgi:hypothetical protein
MLRTLVQVLAILRPLVELLLFWAMSPLAAMLRLRRTREWPSQA